MPKKTARLRRKESVNIDPVVLSVEKIELDIVAQEENVLDEVSRIKGWLKGLFSDHSSLTRGEFVKFFVVPCLVSFLLLCVVLFGVVSHEPLRVPSVHVSTSLHSLSDIASVPLRVFLHPNKLQGQEVFDPYQVTIDLDKGSMFYELVDIRSPQEFAKGHIRDAVNLPAYQHFSDLRSLQLSERTIMSKLHKMLPEKKPLVIYGTTANSQITHDVAAILSRNGWEVSTLGVGWNEWRHFTNLWVPEAGWDSFDITKYVEEAN